MVAINCQGRSPYIGFYPAKGKTVRRPLGHLLRELLLEPAPGQVGVVGFE